MSRFFAPAAILLLAASVVADEKDKDWTGKLVMLRSDGVGSGKPGDAGLVRGGQALTANYVYKVRAEKGEFIELVGHEWIAKSDAVTLDDAVAFFTDKIKAHPKDAASYGRGGPAYQYKGRAHTGFTGKGPVRGDLDAALADLTEAVRLDPKAVAWWSHRGWLRIERREYDKAIQDYDEVIRLEPKWGGGYAGRGTARSAKGETDKAIEDYTTALKIDPKAGGVLNNRGLALADKREYDKAIADYTRAVELDPKHRNAFINRGLAHFAKKDSDKALADLTRALELDPKHVNALRSRGMVLSAKKEYDKAIEDYTRVIELDPKFAAAFNSRGLAWHGKKEYDKALADFTKALELDPKNYLAFGNRGWAWADKNEHAKAVADYDKAIALNPKAVNPVGRRAVSLARLGKYDEAAKGFAEAATLGPPDWLQREHALFLATCPEAKYRDGNAAVRLAAGALERAGKSAGWEYRAALAAAHAEAGDFERAVAEQRKVLGDESLDKDDRKRMEARLELYRAKKPFRDE